ncbi:hypothetical protein HRI_004546500 [Hibiscus trionum]|nr:hypothetical protein HRI_004546500 [Hibiscus trionum]
MASHRRRDNDQSIFTSNSSLFFKIILQETIRDGILGIPTKFVRKYGNQLSSPVKLEVPSGAIWKVELTKSDERVWLQKGWREFAEHYSLELGSFLVFRYQGNDHFHVLVFDRSASEIEYPCRKNKEKSDLPCPLAQKKMRTDSSYKTRNNSKFMDFSFHTSPDAPSSSKIKLGNLEKNEKSHSSTGKVDGVGGISACRSLKMEILSCSQRLTDTEKAHAIQIAGAFKSTENPVFMVAMRPSSVSNSYQMVIPLDFARKFFPMQKCNPTLHNSAGKTWPVTYYMKMNAGEKRQAQLYGGWREFVEDNHLNVGDICVFELITNLEILMKVDIYPVVENESNACRPQANKSIRSRVRTRSTVCVKDTKPGCDPGTNPKLEVLPSGIRSAGSKSCGINLGNLKKVEKSPGQLDAQRSVKTEVFSFLQRLTAVQKAHAVQIASAFKSTGNPVFKAVMQRSFVRDKCKMCIPSDFAREFLTMQKCSLTLCNSTGKTWPAKYYCNPKYKSLKACLYGGWREFVEDNHIDVGDICVFELMKHTEIFMRVVIYPAVENTRKPCRPPVHGSIAGRVETRSLVSDTEPKCQQGPCSSGSREFKDSNDLYIEILDDSPLNLKTKKKSASSSGSVQAKGIKLEQEFPILDKSR